MQDENIMKTQEIGNIKKKCINKWPKVAIIILNWNGWKDTIECLESVFRNNYSNYQVIVVDNGSTDGSMEKIKAWAEGKQEVLTPELLHALYHLSHPPIEKPTPYIYYTREEAEKGGDLKLEEKATKEWQERRKTNAKELNPTSRYPLIFIQTGENIGFAGGNNVGIRYILKKGNCDFIWLLNNDTVIDKKALNYLIEKKNNSLGVIGSKILCYYKPNIIQTVGGGRILPWIGIEKGIGKNEKDNGQWNKNIILDYISGVSFLIKTNTINSVGLIDEKYFLYWEETDWCERIRGMGYKLSYQSKSKIWHKESASIGIGSSIQDYYGTKNGLIFMRRYYNKFWIIGTLVNFIGKVLNRIIRKNYKGLKNIFKAYIDFLIKDKEGN